VVATSPASLAYVAGETGFATMGACAVLAVLILLRAKVWQTPQPMQAARQDTQLVDTSR
jgi:uncharacterized protein